MLKTKSLKAGRKSHNIFFNEGITILLEDDDSESLDDIMEEVKDIMTHNHVSCNEDFIMCSKIC